MRDGKFALSILLWNEQGSKILFFFIQSYKVIEQLETKISAFKKELTDTKEALNRTKLERDVIQQDKLVTSDALGRAEIQKAELELELNKLKSEEAKLRDVLIKMQQLNEGLGHDKVELNKIIIHLEQEKANLNGDKSDLEMVKASLKSELVKVEQEKQDLENERECKWSSFWNWFVYEYIILTNFI